MEVNITRFRAELFELVNRALNGEPIFITHKGARVRLFPDATSGRFSRVTPLRIVNPRTDLHDPSWKEEIRLAWERDWADL
jgi:antitoxin (DNA-binding transcriptional repressor) of toxin-antitoxin stability system